MTKKIDNDSNRFIVKTNTAELHLPIEETVLITRGDFALSVRFNAEGGVTITQNDPAMAELSSRRSSPPAPGTIMADGSVYAGISPDTGRAFYAAAQDAPKRMNWREATSYASACTDHGHADWRVPSRKELGVLFNHRAAIGGFDDSDWYWSSSEYTPNIAWSQRFIDGDQYGNGKNVTGAVRCVRG